MRGRGLVDISPEELGGLVLQSREASWSSFGRRILFYAPGFVYYSNRYFRSSQNSFPSVSVTGSFCSLNCDHCGGKILRTMIPAQTPKRLIEVCSRIKKRGGVGCLVSGGCLPDGSVPLGKFIDSISFVKRKLNLIIVVHTGLVDEQTARGLKKAGVDAVSVDIIGSDDTIREIYKLDASTKAYEQTLGALRDSAVPFTPHVLVGLHRGNLKGEVDALRLIAKYQPSALILIAFFPVKGTAMEGVQPPSPEAITSILVKARLMMPNVPIALGCARPKGKHRVRTDTLAIDAGVNAIAFPSVEAIRRAEALGLETSFSTLCCSMLYRDIFNPEIVC